MNAARKGIFKVDLVDEAHDLTFPLLIGMESLHSTLFSPG